MSCLAVHFRLLGGEISRHLVLQLFSALSCVSLVAFTARQERQRGAVTIRDLSQNSWRPSKGQNRRHSDENSSHTLLERNDCPGEGINVGRKIRARSSVGVQDSRACQGLLLFCPRLSWHFNLVHQLNQGAFSVTVRRNVEVPTIVDCEYTQLLRSFREET